MERKKEACWAKNCDSLIIPSESKDDVDHFTACAVIFADAQSGQGYCAGAKNRLKKAYNTDIRFEGEHDATF